MQFIETKKESDFVKITMENDDEIIIKLESTYAPLTVSNFKLLVSQSFYNGLIFHRVIKDFMIQGGDPTGTGMGGSQNKIKGEFDSNGVKNKLSHERGVISMARSQLSNSASSQFFICHQDAKFLDGNYASFGKVVKGIEVVDKIAQTKTYPNDKPVNEQKIKSITFVNEM